MYSAQFDHLRFLQTNKTKPPKASRKKPEQESTITGTHLPVKSKP
jgi:hypothetical protein